MPGRMRIDEFVTMGEYPPGSLTPETSTSEPAWRGRLGAKPGATNTPPVLSAIKSALWPSWYGSQNVTTPRSRTG